MMRCDPSNWHQPAERREILIFGLTHCTADSVQRILQSDSMKSEFFLLHIQVSPVYYNNLIIPGLQLRFHLVQR